MKKLFLRAEFGPLWEPWEEDEIGRKKLSKVYQTLVSYVLSKIRAENDALRIKMVAKEKYREVLRNRIASQIQEK